MSLAQPLLATIEPDDPTLTGTIDGARPKSARPPPEPIVLTPTNRSSSSSGGQMATTEGDAESGIAGIFRQSAHPLALFFLYFFKVAAISVYILCGWFTDNYVLSVALYVFPVLWVALLVVAILKLGFAFIPIVILALVFNITNVIGFTYADRDAKQKWANSLGAGAWGLGGLGGIGGQIITGAVKRGVGRVFG
ncbi:hypothetical protein EST38_g7617 [Candolleomyces aberdarensis]|uniref:Golgi apparatus membrane protein TVP23 n=1 Tax=Candolleomyces aberdarensis TaxID=2316362 RepID=A0A4Q2DEP3_9AGAR|nr:hypothetical protein EST38_g7617 [Candolleomyces aberdarensis]